MSSTTHSLALAALDLESLTSVLEDRLRGARVRRLPWELRASVTALADDLWRMEQRPGPRRVRRIERANRLAHECWQRLEACMQRLPEERDLIHRSRLLIAWLLSGLDALEADVRERDYIAELGLDLSRRALVRR